jgi:hypothetical protein
MKRSLGVVLGSTAAVLLLGAGPAAAQRAAVEDPAGDATNRGLDITAAAVRNLDHAVVVRVRFVASVRGDVIVSVDPRRARGVRLVSEYRPAGTTENFVLIGAFTDRGPGGRAVQCPGFRVRWSDEEPVVTMRMPSRCLNDGDYGAIRFAVLTERGADSDHAPETRRGDVSVSTWVARG